MPLTNAEFKELVGNRSSRLRVLANKLCETDPNDYITLNDLNQIVLAMKSSGEDGDVNWLRSLIGIIKDGSIERIKKGEETWQQHVAYVRSLSAAGKIPFNIGDKIMIKDTGKFGTVVDYLPEQSKFLVLISPFQLMEYDISGLEKVATKAREN